MTALDLPFFGTLILGAMLVTASYTFAVGIVAGQNRPHLLPAVRYGVYASWAVTAPDQHKPGFPKAARIGAVISIVFLLLMLLGNHRGKVENLWLIAGAVLLAGMLLADRVMRRNGLKR